jgi:hypothetical protein
MSRLLKVVIKDETVRLVCGKGHYLVGKVNLRIRVLVYEVST